MPFRRCAEESYNRAISSYGWIGASGRVKISVVIPVYNGAATLGACLGALMNQTLQRSLYEVIVVDDGSSDETADIANSFSVRLLRQKNAGAPAARNTGMKIANGYWVAFTDADCVPSRGWLSNLLKAVEQVNGAVQPLGAAGKTLGYNSTTAAARFVDLTAGLDAERSLAHPRFPWAPSANLMYRKNAVLEIGGYDERYVTYDACDLHTRLRKVDLGAFVFEPRAIVLHRHRAGWRAYVKQQFSYGIGYAQFVLRHKDEVHWGISHELKTLASLVRSFLMLLVPSRGDHALLQRGMFVRTAVQHAGFLRAYCNGIERRRWKLLE